MLFFELLYPYYLPQYLPVAMEWQARGGEVRFICHYIDSELMPGYRQTLAATGIEVFWVNGAEEVEALCHQHQPDWFIFGNTQQHFSSMPEATKVALMQHGIGPKACYFDMPKGRVDVRFVEGEHRLRQLQARYPEHRFVDTGYAKLDSIVNADNGESLTQTLGLDAAKPTVLYAPTFFPSSIESLPLDFPQHLLAYNLIIKPHYFSLTKKRYRNQSKRLHDWAKSPNVHLVPVADQDITAYMSLADLLVSDASSTLLEFAALDKPVIWCDFYHLRWTYRGPLKFRLKQRMAPELNQYKPLATVVERPGELADAIAHQLANPGQLRDVRHSLTSQLVGRVDGQCSHRVVDCLLS
ncbi:CDP-glycerol glycerophosphotransferase family protein [Ferrimonas kyonanensis]|uniref:CDP-glycerol glycerophosphotransferase family protein n=1 Tax=Ferrimonas kyonanensis TaxID=364763 RepID=UPI0003FED1F4|nr:CDP-glycerol glycerophosphotransferase family protein [Ferrimonas kyonanensis]